MSDEEVLDLAGLKKPRKKPKVLVEVEDDYEYTDYTYDELLGFIFEKVREQDPEFAYGGRKKLVMKPPQTIISRKKSIFTNFFEICRLLKRDPKHLMQFLLSELGSKGSIDGNQWLIIEGRYQQKNFESLLRKYIKDYVTCRTCHSFCTELIKDTRLFFLQCQACGSRSSVTAIKSGFTAIVGKRSELRRAAETTTGK